MPSPISAHKRTAKVLSLQRPPESLRTFHTHFGDYLRDQNPQQTATKHPDLVKHIPERVGRVYRELIYNNLTGFINQCFPICQTLISQQQWDDLSLAFFQQGSLNSPYFSEINQHFVDYLYQLTDEQRQQLGLPPFFADLAHYEWVELLLDVAPDSDVATEIYLGASLNPVLENLHYPWPVQRISADKPPQEKVETFLIVYRNRHDVIAFMEANAMTHALVAFMLQKTADKQTFENARTLIGAFYDLVGVEKQPTMIAFGEQLIAQLEERDIILTESTT